MEVFPESFGSSWVGFVVLSAFVFEGVRLWFLRVSAAMEHFFVCSNDRGVSAEEIFLLHFVHEVLRFDEPGLEVAKVGEETTKISAQPLGVKRLVLCVEAL